MRGADRPRLSLIQSHATGEGGALGGRWGQGAASWRTCCWVWAFLDGESWSCREEGGRPSENGGVVGAVAGRVQSLGELGGQWQEQRGPAATALSGGVSQGAFSCSWSFVWSTLGVTAIAFVTGALGFWAPKFLFEARVVHGLQRPCLQEPCNSQDR